MPGIGRYGLRFIQLIVQPLPLRNLVRAEDEEGVLDRFKPFSTTPRKATTAQKPRLTPKPQTLRFRPAMLVKDRKPFNVRLADEDWLLAFRLTRHYGITATRLLETLLRERAHALGLDQPPLKGQDALSDLLNNADSGDNPA